MWEDVRTSRPNLKAISPADDSCVNVHGFIKKQQSIAFYSACTEIAGNPVGLIFDWNLEVYSRLAIHLLCCGQVDFLKGNLLCAPGGRIVQQ